MNTSPIQPAKPTRSGQLQGLNQLRFLAAVLVFTQHAISNSHADEWIDVGGFRIGRIGTAIFFLLSGFLAAASTREPLTWLKSRIAVLFPPYWIVTISGFILAGVTATKSFDVWQVASQMAGLGYFTHGDHIVNIATWFISPLLALYVAVTLIRLTSPRLMLPVVIVATVAYSLSLAADFSTLHCHFVTFFMAFAVASIPERNRTTAAACMAVSLLTLCLFQPEFRYGALGSCLLLVALQIRNEVRVCNWFASIAYEWFLVHGLCLAIVSHLTQMPTVIFTAGVILSVLGAVVLKKMVQAIGRTLTARGLRSKEFSVTLLSGRRQRQQPNASQDQPSTSMANAWGDAGQGCESNRGMGRPVQTAPVPGLKRSRLSAMAVELHGHPALPDCAVPPARHEHGRTSRAEVRA